MSRRRLAAVAVVAAACSFSVSRADTLYWNGGTFGWGTYNWTSTAFPMSPTQVPTSVDTAFVGSGTVVFPVSNTYSVMNVEFDGSGGADGTGQLVVKGGLTFFTSGNVDTNLTINGAATWTAGTLNGIGTVASISATGSLAINPGTFDISNRTLVNNGVVSSGAIQFRGGGNGSSVLNDGLWVESPTTTSGSQFNSGYGGNGLAFTNGATGTFRHTGTNTTTFFVPFYNNGLVDTQGGTVVIQLGGEAFGGSTFNAAAGASNVFTAGYSLGGLVAFTGAGYNGMTGGVLSGNGVISGVFNWDGGTLNSASTVTFGAGSVVNITAAAADLANATVVNYGTVNRLGGNLRGGGNGSLFVNYGTFNDNVVGTSEFDNAYGGNGFTFSNAAGGTFNKTSASVTNLIATFNNAGAVNVESGTLNFTYGSSVAGSTITAFPGTAATFSNYVLGPGVTYTGAGLFQLVGGGSQVIGVVNATNFQIAGGTNTLASVTFTGSNVTWTGGTLNGGGIFTVGPTGSLAISSSLADLANTTFVNAGTVTATGTQVRGGSNGTAIVNNALWVDQPAGSNLQFNSAYGGNGATFYNYGTLRQTTTNTTTFAGMPLYHYGTIDTQSGTLAIAAGGEAFGGSSFNAAAGATNAFTAGYTLAGDVRFSGAGANELAAGTLYGTYAVVGSFLWAGGNMSSVGTTTIYPGSTLTMAASPNDLPGRDIELQGIAYHTNGDLRGGGNGSVINNSDLFIESNPADDQINAAYGGNGFTFNNYATFLKASGSTTTVTGIAFNNYGTVNVAQGTVSFSSTLVSFDGSTINAGAGAFANYVSPTFSGTVNFTGSGVQELTAGTAYGTHALAGNFLWGGGTFDSVGVTIIPVGSTFTADIATTEDLTSRTFDIYGTFVHAIGEMRGGGSGSVINNSGLFLEASPVNDQIDGTLGGNGLLFNNYATFRTTTNVTTTLSSGGMAFNNYGLVDVEAGTLTFASSLVAQDGSTLSASGGTVINYVTPTFLGTIHFTGSGTHEIVGGTVYGTNALVGNVFWYGGTFDSPGASTIPVGSTLTANTGSTEDLSSYTFNVYGTFVHAGGEIRGGGSGSVINNYGLFEEAASANDSIDGTLGGNGLVFNNYGTFRSTTNVTTTLSNGDMVFNNYALVQAQSGVIYFNGSYAGQDGSTVSASGGAAVEFTSPTFSGTVTFTGAGTNELVSGTVYGTHALAGTFLWVGGNFDSSGTTIIPAGSTLVAEDPSTEDMTNRTFNIYGTFNHAVGEIRGGSATINNYGLFEETSAVNDSIDGTLGGNGLAFNNYGTFRSTTNVTTTLSNGDMVFNNYALVQAQSGVIYFNGSYAGQDGSTVSASGGAAVEFTSPTFSGTVTFTGAGLNELVGGTVYGTHALAGTFLWVGGNFDSSGTTIIPAGSTLVAEDPSTEDMTNRTFNIYGTFNHAVGEIRGGSATINNYGLFEETSAVNDQLDGTLGGNGLVFNNYGTFRSTTNVTTTLSNGNMVFNNYALVQAQSGVIYFNGSYSGQTGSTVSASGGAAVEFTSPTFAGTVTFTGAGTNEVVGGVVSGTHVIEGRLDWFGGSFSSGGTTTVGSNGTLEVGASPSDAANRTIVNNGAVIQDAVEFRGGSTTIQNNGTWTVAGAGAHQIDSSLGGNGLTFANGPAGAVSIVSSSGTLTLSGIGFSNAGLLDAGPGSLVVNSSSFSQTAGVTHLGGGTISGGSVLYYTGGSIAGTGSISSPVSITGTTISPDGPLGYLNFSSLSVVGPVSIPSRVPGPELPTVTVIESLAFSGPGALDISDNDLILRGTSEVAVRALVTSGLVTSSYSNSYAGIGVITNGDGEGGSLYANFDGQAVSATDVLVKYTYLGDTNLDGVVDAQDVANTLAGVYGHLTGWVNGDFNYDGAVTSADVTILLTSLSHEGASFGDSTGGGGAVPEPGSVGWVGAVGVGMGLRRRRRVG
jgi:hypothetical protein